MLKLNKKMQIILLKWEIMQRPIKDIKKSWIFTSALKMLEKILKRKMLSSTIKSTISTRISSKSLGKKIFRYQILIKYSILIRKILKKQFFQTSEMLYRIITISINLNKRMTQIWWRRAKKLNNIIRLSSIIV